MRNRFNQKISFYVKTLVAYGVILALLYCSSMLHEQQYNPGDQLDVVEKCSIGTEENISANEVIGGYPYARLTNRLSQARCLEAEFHHYTVDFSRNYGERLEEVIVLHQSIKKVCEKLKQERASFLEYLAVTRFQVEARQANKKNEPTLCLRGRCRRSSTIPSSALSRKARQKKSQRYMCQVLANCIERLDIMVYNLGKLIEQAQLRDEAARARSENAARFRSGAIVLEQADVVASTQSESFEDKKSSVSSEIVASSEITIPEEASTSEEVSSTSSEVSTSEEVSTINEQVASR